MLVASLAMCVKRLYCDCAIVMNVYAVEGLCKMPSLLLFYGRGKSSRLGREESMDACDYEALATPVAGAGRAWC